MKTISRNRVLMIAATMALMLQTQLVDVGAEENTESVAGLYVGKTIAARGPYNISGRHFAEEYLYLAPDGTFYEGYAFAGYDQFNQTNDVELGRYSIQNDRVLFRYQSGKEGIIRREEGNLDFSLIGNTRRLPNCDGLKLSGTYQLSDFGIGITFTPDGRFVDHGAMPQILNLTDSRIDSPVRTLRPGPGSYTIKNHTITLRYAHGPVFQLFFYVDGDNRGQIDAGIMHILTYELSRQGGSPTQQPSITAARLFKIRVPPGWKIRRDGTNKNLTYVVPGDLASGKEVKVLVGDPERVPEGKTIVAPIRFHDAIVQGAVKKMATKGGRITKSFTADTLGQTLSSTGMLTETNGKQFRMTMFTPMSNSEAQLVVYMAESDNLYASYLPAVKAMFGESDASPQASMTSLETLLSKMRTNVTVLNGWSSEFDAQEEGTHFSPLNLSAGQFVDLVVEKRVKLTSTLAQAHDESVRKGIASLEKENGRLEGTPHREEREGTVLTSVGALLSNGMKIWAMSAATAVGDEMQEVSLITSSEDLSKQYLPTLKVTLTEVAGR